MNCPICDNRCDEQNEQEKKYNVVIFICPACEYCTESRFKKTRTIINKENSQQMLLAF